MRKSHRILIGAVAAAAALAGSITIASASAPTAPFTALTIDGSGDSPILGAGQSKSFSGSEVTLTNDAGGGITVAAGTFTLAVSPEIGSVRSLVVTEP